MVEYDLHIHSTASDGILGPREIFKIAYEKKLKGIAITDHDSVGSLNEGMSLSLKYGIDFIPGIELSTDFFNREIHLLGYFIDFHDESFNKFLLQMQNERFDRAIKMVGIISSLGYNVSLDEVLNSNSEKYHSIGRPHIAKLLINKGYFNDMNKVFETLIGEGKPAYVDRNKVSTIEGIKKIIDVGGVPVLAHPMLIKDKDKFKLENMIFELKQQGLMGIEVYHSKQSQQDSQLLYRIAHMYDLIVTGGSDCHGGCIGDDFLLGSKGISTQGVNILKSLRR